MEQVTTRQTIYFISTSDLWSFCASLQQKVYHISTRARAVTLECSGEEVQRAIHQFNALQQDRKSA